jgi:PST family polysaccharide transporter
VSQQGLTHAVLNGIVWMSWGKLARAVLQVVVLAVLARLLGPADFGVVSGASVVIGFAAIFGHLGFGKGLIQLPSLRDAHVAVAFHSSVLLGILLGVAVAMCGEPFARFLRIEQLTMPLQVMALTFPLRGLAVASEALLQRELRFRWLANREVASYAIGYAGVGVTLAYLGWGAWALVAAHLVQTAVNTLLILVARPIRIGVLPDRRAAADLLFFSGGYTLGRVANYLGAEGDNLVIGRCLGPAALGLYGRAFQLMAVPADIFGDILDNVLFPTMARAEPQRLADAYRRGVSLIALVTLPASVVFVLLAHDIVHVILGPSWAGAVGAFQLLALGLLCRTSCRMSDALARARGFVYRRAWRQAVYATLVIGGAWLGQHRGVNGAALGVLVALAVNFFLMAQLSLGLAGMSWRSFLGAHTHAVVLACSAALIVHALSTALTFAAWAPAARLFASAAAVTVVLIAAGTWRPSVFLGSDGLWMIDALQGYSPVLRRWSAARVR